MNTYQTEQFETLTMIRRHLNTLSKTNIEHLRAKIREQYGKAES